jgi:hypothetical protein
LNKMKRLQAERYRRYVAAQRKPFRYKIRGLSRRYCGRRNRHFVIDLLANGFTRLAYDGQYFFDTDHASVPLLLKIAKGVAFVPLDAGRVTGQIRFRTAKR